MSKHSAINSSNPQPTAAASEAVSIAVLENLAARLNPNALLLCMVRAGGGAVAYHDARSKRLVQPANALPGLSAQAMQSNLRLLDGMVRDQLRLSGLEGELNSLSGQLSNSYEELSLIYQLSGGMKINRSATDFFKQACLDVMNVMSVRGMGVALRADDGYRQEPVLYGALSLPPGKVHRLADELLPVLRQRTSPLLVNNLSKDKNFNWLAEHAHQLLAVPLMRQEQLLGCL